MVVLRLRDAAWRYLFLPPSAPASLAAGRLLVNSPRRKIIKGTAIIDFDFAILAHVDIHWEIVKDIIVDCMFLLRRRGLAAQD